MPLLSASTAMKPVSSADPYKPATGGKAKKKKMTLNDAKKARRGAGDY